MKRFVIFFIAVLIGKAAFAQPEILWSRTYGGAGNDVCSAMQQTSDSGYILAGSTTSFGSGLEDFWLVKTNANGDSLWSRTYGGSGDDACHAMQQTSDGGFILAGSTSSFGAGGSDFWLLKTDANGDSLWSRTFGGDSADICNALDQTSDGGYVLAGSTRSFGAGSEDIWLVKTDGNGDSLWSRTLGGSSDDECYSMQQTTDGGYVLAGTFGVCSRLVKTDANGDSLWGRTLGCAPPGYGDWGEAYAVHQTGDGGYVLAGLWRIYYFEMRHASWLLKTDANGDSVWSRYYPYEQDPFNSVQQTSDGGYIAAGWTTLKTDTNGDSLWSRSSGCCAIAVQQTTDGGYALAGSGWGSSDFRLVRLVPMPEILVDPTMLMFGHVRIGSDSSALLKIRNTGEAPLTVLTMTAPEGYAALFDLPLTIAPGDSVTDTVRFSPTEVRPYFDTLAVTSDAFSGSVSVVLRGFGVPPLSADDLACEVPRYFALRENYPNPFNPSTTITYDLPKAGHVSLRVFDVLGREVTVLKDGMTEAGSHQVMFDGSSLASGIYFARLEAGEFVQTKKLMLLK